MKRLTYLLAGLMIPALIWAGWRQVSGSKGSRRRAQVVHAEVRVLGRRIVERGVLVSLQSTPVRLGADGELLEITATGTAVEAGEVIVRSDDQQVRDRLENEQFGLFDGEQELAAAQANLDYTEAEQDSRIALLEKRLDVARVEERLARIPLTAEERRLLDIEHEIARLDCRDAEEEYERQRRLFEKSFISAAMLEPYQRRAETARAAVREVEERITLQEKGKPPEELLELRKRVERIEAERQRSEQAKERRLNQVRQTVLEAEARVRRHKVEIAHREEDLDGSTVTAAAAGIMSIRLYHNRGTGWVEYGPGIQRSKYDHIADIINPGSMRAEFMVHEADVEHIVKGMRAHVRVAAHPGMEFAGTVVEVGGVGRDRSDVAPLGYESGRAGITMFNAAVSLPSEGADLRPGMSATIEVIVEEPRERLVLPRAALVWRDDRFYVTVERDGTWREQPVEGDVIDSVYFDVTAGLEAGDTVRLPDGSGDAS